MKTIHRHRFLIATVLAVLASPNPLLASDWSEVFTSSVPFSAVSRLPIEFVSISGSSVARSPDGTNWTVQAANMAVSSWCATSSDNFLGVAVISNAVWVVVSSNLTEWTAQDQVRYLGQDLLRWSCVVSSTNRSLCLIDIQPWGYLFGGPWRYMYAAERSSASWQQVAPDIAAPSSLSASSEHFHCIATPDTLRSCVYASADGETWTRLSPLWCPAGPFSVSYSVVGYAVEADVVLSVQGNGIGNSYMGVYVPTHDEFLSLPPGPENAPGHDVIHYDGRRISISGNQTLYSGATEYFLLWSDDFAATWHKKIVPAPVTQFASSDEATIAVGSGRFLWQEKSPVTMTNLAPAQFTGITGDAAETNVCVHLAVNSGTVYRLEVCTNLAEGAWTSYGLPFLATNETSTVHTSGATNGPFFVRGRTLFKTQGH
jgi:hypothetical protein